MEILNYKCPNCSAGLEFNSKTQKMACEYCGNSYTVEELEELEEQKEEPLKEEDSRGTGRNLTRKPGIRTAEKFLYGAVPPAELSLWQKKQQERLCAPIA